MVSGALLEHIAGVAVARVSCDERAGSSELAGDAQEGKESVFKLSTINSKSPPPTRESNSVKL